MKGPLVALVVLAAAIAAPPLSASPKATYHRMTGTIASVLAVEAHLTISGDGRVSGTYFYVRVGVPLGLRGTLDAAGELLLTEFDQTTGRTTGSFRGTLAAGQASGIWTNAAGTRSFSFALVEDPGRGMTPAVLEISDRTLLDPDAGEGPAASASLVLLVPGTETDVEALVRRGLFDGTTPEEWARAQASEFLTSYLEEAGPLYRHDPKSASLNWSMGVTDEVLYDGGSWLCMRRSRWDYTGGAHDNLRVEYAVFDLAGARRLALQDLVAPESQVELARRITTALRAAEGLAPDQKLSEAGYFGDDVEAPDSFYLTPAGLFFHFDPYDIAPWARGPVDVLVPWEDLRGLLRVHPVF